MTKIAVAGIGGVGGYFGGLLAHYYRDKAEAEIYFVVRGENELVIKQRGLVLDTTHGRFTAYPKKATHNSAEIGAVDYLIVSCKSYSLTGLLADVRGCVGPHTVIVPLLNGVDSGEKIRAVYPENEVWDGCAYLVGRLSEPGLIKESGVSRVINFGLEKGNAERLKDFEFLLKQAGLDARLHAKIRRIVWIKYVFISTVASVTSYLNLTLGELRQHEHGMELLNRLIDEVLEVAAAMDIDFGTDVRQRTLTTLFEANPETRTSMNSDFLKGGLTEVDSITGYVVKRGKDLSVSTPVFETIYEALKNR